jgi:hypothetical protein
MSRECDAVASHGGVDVTSADPSNSEAERIDGFKVALTHLFSLEAELDAELNELHKRHAINLRELRAEARWSACGDQGSQERARRGSERASER